MTSPANETASNSPPAVLSAAQRHDLARQFEQAKRLAAQSPPHFRGVHQVLSDCCTLDPGNTLFVAALLENLRNAKGRTASAWFWQVWQLRAQLGAAVQEQKWRSALAAGWALLGEVPGDVDTLRTLAEICAALGHRPTQIMLLHEAREIAPKDVTVLRPLALAFGATGQFVAAATVWQQLLNELPSDQEAASYLKILLPKKDDPSQPATELARKVDALLQARQWDAAERMLTQDSGAEGANLELRALGEEIILGRARERTEIARQLAEHSPSQIQQQLVSELLEEQRRIELGVAFARYERFSSDPAKSWELAGCLTRAGNYSEALKYLSPLTNDEKWRLPALIAAGENWQHLRQFERALGAYREALSRDSAAGKLDPQNEHVQRGWYRGAVLAEATGDPRSSLAWLEELTAVNPGYKDASARLVNLRAICNKGGFPAEPQSDSSRGT